MSKLRRLPRRAILLGMMLSLGFAAFSFTRPVSKAQEPAKPIDRKALREQITALHAEIELLELDHEIERTVIFDLCKEDRTIIAKLDSIIEESIRKYRKDVHVMHAWMADEKDPTELLKEKFASWGGSFLGPLARVDEMSDDELRKDMLEGEQQDKAEAKEGKEEFVKVFGKEIAEEVELLAEKAKKKEDLAEARNRLAEHVKEGIMKKATAEVRPKIASRKKEFARQAAELAGKRLDLETLERQYREAR